MKVNMLRMSTCPKMVAAFGFAIVLVVTMSGCVNHSFETRTLDQIRSAGFDAKAQRICTVTGSPTLPLHGSPRTAAASNSTVGEVRTLVNSGSEKQFLELAGKLADKTYVALCFFQGDKSLAPPNGRFLVAEFTGDGGSAIVGRW